MAQQYVVIGLGRFGSSVARTLVELGAEVLAVDKDPQAVQEAVEYTDDARVLEATNTRALDDIGVGDFDGVIICIEDIQTSLMISMLCEEAGAKQIITKAQTDLQANLLRKIGVDECVFPERSAGEQLAQRLMTSDILQFINMSDDYGTAGLNAHPEWIGRTLADLGFRSEYGLNIVALRHSDASMNMKPSADDHIKEGDMIYVIGSVDDINAIQKKLSKGEKL